MSGDLDEFFARCDDVLDNWHGSEDAMHAKALPDGTYQTGPTIVSWPLMPMPPVVVITPAQARALLAAASEFAARR
jgi:hypothetical protein